MSATFDDLREDFARAFRAIEDNGETTRRAIESIFEEQRKLWRAIEDNGETTRRAIESIFEEQRKLWADQAELRDDLHALANRLEANTRG